MALAFIPLSFLLCPSQQLEAAHQHCNLLLMELNLCTHISAVSPPFPATLQRVQRNLSQI